MKHAVKSLRYWALSLAIGCAAVSNAKDTTLTGEIMDKMCAQMGSHDNMMKSENATNAKDCALKCVKDGGSFALYDASTKKVYPLEDTKQVRQYAGERVSVTGNYDSNADLLHVKSISPAK